MFDFRSKEKIIRDIKYTEFNNFESSLVMVTAYSKNKTIGELKASVGQGQALLGDIDISEEYVNYGIGTQLLIRFETICAGRNVNEITGNLSLVDLDHKDRLIHFYKKHNYKIQYEENGNYWGKISKKL